MKPRFFFPALGLVAVLVAASCAPAVTYTPAMPIASPLGAVAIPVTATLVESSESAATTAPTQSVEVQAVATSRGPNLEATDPATVSLASGQLQLVEFFRFT